jgi:hypothetical protein
MTPAARKRLLEYLTCGMVYVLQQSFYNIYENKYQF